ncbi:MAG: TlyA family RNA methyltransferase [Acidobacteriota bacterium]
MAATIDRRAGRRARADELVVRLGLATDVATARAMILAGEVWREAERIEKPGRVLPAAARLERHPRRAHASRAGSKLAGALDDLAVPVTSRRCLDIGASTGGFTDCLLSRGAAHVTALDVGRGLLDARLRNDPRVSAIDSVNARSLAPDDFPLPFALVTVDVSFISLTAIVPALPALLDRTARPSPDILLLVKPQFEAPRRSVPRGGVVRDSAVAMDAIARVGASAASAGLIVLGSAPSRVKGAGGNQEHFLRLALPTAGSPCGPRAEMT